MTAVNNVPDFKVTLDGTDLTDRIRPRRSLSRSVMSRGGDADQLEITLDDSDGRLAMPREGATLSVQLGWSAGSGVTIGMVDKGKFTVDEVEHSGPPDQIRIRARAADFTSAIATRREKSWHDTTLGAIVKEIAGRNRLTPRCAPALASIAVKVMAQTRESDIALLRRLGREHDAVATVKAGALILAPTGAATTATGATIPAITIRRGDGDRHSFRIRKREEAGSVSADWHDRKGAKKKTVTVGSGTGEVKRLARTYPTEDAARRAATAEQGRAAREPRSLDLGLALGRLEIYPDRPVTMTGFKSEICAVKWLVADVTHELLPDRGFTSALTLESMA
jgi:phage protein D